MANSILENEDTFAPLVGRVANGFGDLLSSIRGNTSLALKTLDPHSATHKNIREIETAVRRGGMMVEKLLACSGNSVPTLREVTITRLLDHLVESIDRLVGDNVVISYNQVVGVPLIYGDLNQLRQAISNILVNAVEAIGSADGTITIQSGVMTIVPCMHEVEDLTPGRYVFVKISDTGVGMTAPIQEKIFEPFFSTKGGGRGLGLAAALGTIRAHGGSITTKSLVGHGTTVTILLPVAAKRPRIKKPAPEQNLALLASRRRVDAETPQLEMAVRDY